MASNKFREVQLDEAELPDLRSFLEQENIDFAPQNNAAQLRALIQRAGFGLKGHITLVAEPAAVDVSFGSALQEGVDLTNPDQVNPEIKPFLVVELQLHPGRSGEMSPADVDVDGVMMRIPRQQKVQIPYRYYEALAHAVGTDYAESEDGLGEGQRVHTYPHQVFRIFEQRDPEKLRLINQRVARMHETDKRNRESIEKRRKALEAAAAAA